MSVIFVKGKGIPGPGVYSVKSISMNNKGSYFVSKFKSSLGKSFGHSTRPSIADNKGYPGPGLYTSPSDFPEIRSKSKRGNSQSMSTLLAKKSSMSKTTKETTSKEWFSRIFC